MNNSCQISKLPVLFGESRGDVSGVWGRLQNTRLTLRSISVSAAANNRKWKCLIPRLHRIAHSFATHVAFLGAWWTAEIQGNTNRTFAWSALCLCPLEVDNPFLCSTSKSLFSSAVLPFCSPFSSSFYWVIPPFLPCLVSLLIVLPSSLWLLCFRMRSWWVACVRDICANLRVSQVCLIVMESLHERMNERWASH